MAKRIVWRGKNKGRYVSRQGGTTMHYHSGPIEMNLMPGRLVDRGASVTTVFEGYTARADAELLVDLREMGARRPGRDRELRLSTVSLAASISRMTGRNASELSGPVEARAGAWSRPRRPDG